MAVCNPAGLMTPPAWTLLEGLSLLCITHNSHIHACKKTQEGRGENSMAWDILP